MIKLGYFILGFIIVFYGGLWYIRNWDLFDFRFDDDKDDWGF